ncbi:hypothetical protein BX070DRAFT_88994 [Coemansia spiralis]|nr:hypothetical protein BX070DRAFT_88994 [Coemansia spiralis]
MTCLHVAPSKDKQPAHYVCCPFSVQTAPRPSLSHYAYRSSLIQTAQSQQVLTSIFALNRTAAAVAAAILLVPVLATQSRTLTMVACLPNPNSSCLSVSQQRMQQTPPISIALANKTMNVDYSAPASACSPRLPSLSAQEHLQSLLRLQPFSPSFFAHIFEPIPSPALFASSHVCLSVELLLALSAVVFLPCSAYFTTKTR